MLPALLTTVLFAISAVCANRTTRILGGIEANFFRVSLATMLLACWAHAWGNGLNGRALPYFLLSGCVGFGIGDLALYQAFPRLGSRLCMILVHCIAAPFGAVVEWCWLGTGITAPQILYGMIILLGIVIALAPDTRMTVTRDTLISGIIFGTIAGCGQGFGAVLSRRAYQVADSFGEKMHGINGGVTAAYQRILAGWLIATAFYFATTGVRKKNGTTGARSPSDVRTVLTPKRRRAAWPWLAGNALSGPFIGVTCFQWALTTTPTAIVLPVVAMTPLVVIPFARIVEGDRPGFRSLAGAMVAVLGVAALTWTRVQR